MYVFNHHEKRKKNKKSKHLLLILCYFIVYCCNIEIKLLHIVLVLGCIEDIVDSSQYFF